MSDDFKLIAVHVVEHLPDSLRERKALLNALRRLLPSTHPVRKEVVGLLYLLDQHEILQRELPLLFAQQSKGAKK